MAFDSRIIGPCEKMMHCFFTETNNNYPRTKRHCYIGL